LEAGLVTDKITTDNFEVTAGLRGNLGEFGDYFKTWQWESGFRYSEDDRTESLGGIVNTNALRAALLDTNPATAFNPFGLNQNSPAVIDKVFTTVHRSGEATLILEDLKVTGNLFSLPAGLLAFAIGGEHRTEHATDQPDPLTASGQTMGSPLGRFNTDARAPDFLPTNGGRDVWSLYWELRVPVTSPAWNCYGLHSLELGYQERFDHYSDFGSTEKPKFFLRWQPIDSSLTFRGTYSEAYHAPTIYELYTSQAQRTVPVSDPATVPLNDPLGRPPFLPNGDPTPLTLPDKGVKEAVGGNPNLQPETAYEWTYGFAWTPAKLIKGLTLSANFYHIDLRNAIVDRDTNNILGNNWGSRTGTLPNGAPTGGFFSDLIQRDPSTGEVVSVNAALQNGSRIITEGLDYEASYQLDSSSFGQCNFGTFTFTFNGNYVSRYVEQATPASSKINLLGQFWGPRLGSFPQNRWYASLLYDLGGLDAGAVVNFIGQMRDTSEPARKIREWTTLDLVVNYTFHLSNPVTEPVPGYAKDASKNVEMTDDEDKNVMPVSTAGYGSRGWRAWLDNTTITVGMNNVFDQDPPFVSGYLENGYDEWQANIRGRVCYVALKKRF
jgi:outer membrane receptor protein involved in Fe transport